mmetsp:Transcript_84741/g.162050  ORF Transcript_84741/g.162050 Transcript_84741/m.162050 type:complete len:362 (-) Transcript_84741:9-1094(-)
MLGTCDHKAPKTRRENCTLCNGTGETGIFGSKGFGLVKKPCPACSPTGCIDAGEVTAENPLWACALPDEAETTQAEASTHAFSSPSSAARMRLPPTANREATSGSDKPSDRTYHSCMSSWESSGFVPMPRSSRDLPATPAAGLTTPTADHAAGLMPLASPAVGMPSSAAESPARLRPSGTPDLAGAEHVQIAATEGSPQYEGQFLDSVPHGHGCERWPGGAGYEGQYRAGKKHGNGRFVWTNGSCYDGEFLENKMSGIGVIRWSDGSSYEGEWKQGVMWGRGFFKWADGKTYDGEYHNDLKHGQGIFRWPDGRLFDGQWSKGQQEGTGTYTEASGRKRTGHWRGGKLKQWVSAIETPTSTV